MMRMLRQPPCLARLSGSLIMLQAVLKWLVLHRTQQHVCAAKGEQNMRSGEGGRYTRPLHLLALEKLPS
jgi:hypothetical protein